MADEVGTTPTVDTGRTEESAPAPTTTDEVSTEAVDTGDTSAVTEPAEQADDLGVQLSLDDVPAPLRSTVEKHLKNYEKQFKSAYTKKTMSLAEERKTREAEYEQTKTAKEQLEALAVEVLKDPSRLSHYRKMYGLPEVDTRNQTPEVVEEKPLETVGDLLSEMDRRVEAKLQETQRTVREQQMAESARAQAVGKWESALVAHRTDPKFSKYEKLIVGIADDPEYHKMYRSGLSEKEVLGRAYEKFKSLFREDLEAAKNEGLKALDAKKRGTTASPGKTVNMKSTSDGTRTREEIIQAVRSKVGIPT